MISSEGSGTNDMKHTLEVYLNNRWNRVEDN
jgi:hypothetical protein